MLNFWKKKGQIALNDRQMAIVERIISEGQITNRDIRSMFGISDNVARTETSKLEDLGVIKRIGQGRSTRYVLT